MEQKLDEDKIIVKNTDMRDYYDRIERDLHVAFSPYAYVNINNIPNYTNIVVGLSQYDMNKLNNQSNYYLYCNQMAEFITKQGYKFDSSISQSHDGTWSLCKFHVINPEYREY